MAKNTANTNEAYKATIRESSKELSAKERVMFKDFSNAKSMVDYVHEAREVGGKATIDVDSYVVIDVFNPKASDNTDYTVYLVIDKNGEKYYTSSQAFWSAFANIYSEMKDSNEEWGVELVLIPSKNYKGKEILTCSLI